MDVFQHQQLYEQAIPLSADCGKLGRASVHVNEALQVFVKKR
jgi:hypothetical protein